MKKFPMIWFLGLAVLLIPSFLLKALTLYESIQILFTFTLVFVTIQYAISTAKMAKEMELTRKVQDKPSLIAYFDNSQSILLDLVVKNIGYGAAKDVKLKIDPPLYDHQDRDIAKLSLMKQGVNFFPPNREFRQIIGTTQQFFGEDSKRPLEYKLTASYSDIEGNPVPDQVIPLDLSVYRDLPIHRESDIDKLTKEIHNLADKIKSH
jgi:hypothetical protein